MASLERWQQAVEPRPRWWQQFALWYMRRSFGKAPDPLRIMARVPRVFLADVLYETVFAKSRKAPPRLKILAGQRVSSLVGCPW